MLKKIVSVLIICVLLIASVLVATGEKADEITLAATAAPDGGIFDFEVLEKLYMDGENIVFSPISLKIALAMAADGANGETLAEILAAMNIASTDDIVSTIPGAIHSANAAFTSDMAPLFSEYIDRLNEAYGAEWFQIDDKVLENANSWAYQNTNGLIDPLLTEKPDAMTGLILMNAVAMDADWQFPFYEDSITKEMFHTADGDVEVDMMHQISRFDYAEHNGVQLIRLPYANSSLNMYILLPEEGGIPQLLSDLSAQGIGAFDAGLSWQEVDFALPKMDISDENGLNEVLAALGVNKAFGSEADFSGMSEVPMYISEVFQKARIQIDEAGTKAAASTVIAMPMMAPPPAEAGPAVMHVDRPFVFVVADAENGSVCFSGVVENPAAE